MSLKNKRVPKLSVHIGAETVHGFCFMLKLLLVMVQESFSVFPRLHLPFSLPFCWKMYRNDISTLPRKVFNILIFLSTQNNMYIQFNSRIPLLLLLSLEKVCKLFFSFFLICMWCLRVTFLIQQHNLTKLYGFFLSFKMEL